MTFLMENWMLVLLALTSGGGLLWITLVQGGVPGGLAPADAVQLINREKAVVVDVCSGAEFAAGHVVGAKHVPLETLEATLPGLVKSKKTPLILVCASGMRSKRALAVAKQLGYETAHSLAGGMRAWRAADLPIEKS